MSELTGQILDGRYRVDERVGSGAMGAVYRGERLKLGRVVAIKVMQEGMTNDAFRKRFEREAMAMAKLEHPHCASVLDVGAHDDCPYVIMEFVDGKNLKQLIEEGPLPIPRAIDVMRQVLSGLAHAHEHGVIHRDIKPANIVLSQKSGLGDHVKILDFGLARFHAEASNLTAGIIVGTPNYMAPEQISGAPVDQRIDLYACGVMLFELLTGVKPFTADGPVAICMKHLKDSPPRLADAAPGRSFGALEDVVARALEKDPARRFATADEFSQALGQLAARRSEPRIDAVPDPTMVDKPRPRRRGIAIAIVGVAALGIGAVVATSRGQTDPPKRDEPAPVGAAPVPLPQQPAPAPAPPPPPPPPQPAPHADPAANLVAQAGQLAGAGRREAAISVLTKARKTYPDDARVPYTLAKLYFDKMWWPDGLKQARAALALDPGLKTDPDLIKLVLFGFTNTASYDWTLAKFLHDDIGDAAKPYMEDAAKNNPNPIVRSRASAELRRYK